MAGISTYLSNILLNMLRGQTPVAPPATFYLGFFNGDPDAGGTEVTTSIRTAGRVAVAFTAISSRQIKNSADIDFGLCAGNVTITHNGLFDAQSGGNLWYSKPIVQRQTAQGDPLKYPANQLTYSVPTITS